jgi:hypothetical protein
MIFFMRLICHYQIDQGILIISHFHYIVKLVNNLYKQNSFNLPLRVFFLEFHFNLKNKITKLPLKINCIPTIFLNF